MSVVIPPDATIIITIRPILPLNDWTLASLHAKT